MCARKCKKVKKNFEKLVTGTIRIGKNSRLNSLKNYSTDFEKNLGDAQFRVGYFIFSKAEIEPAFDRFRCLVSRKSPTRRHRHNANRPKLQTRYSQKPPLHRDFENN